MSEILDLYRLNRVGQIEAEEFRYGTANSHRATTEPQRLFVLRRNLYNASDSAGDGLLL